ncbi:hypothetical protein [Rice orange leaf phytoplasma]|uniref:hypothetical protein n=1 Tax=Rice orange leaf phytoplasma TaxID=146897 RepID=UPI0008F5F785|nr:hypothetical protein [Rice orange leaf phytoplasma]OIJ44628.1 hypothetical protein BHE82_02910 [Rice orange leaf phytoplasma]
MQIVSLGKKKSLFFSLFLFSVLFISLFNTYQTVGAELTTETTTTQVVETLGEDDKFVQTVTTVKEGNKTTVTTKDADGKVTKKVVTKTVEGVKTETTTEPSLNKVTVKTFGDGGTVTKTEVTTTTTE